MKTFNLIFLILFLIFSFLQLNNPDPLLWFGLYFLGAAACAVGVVKKTNKGFLWLLLALYLIYAGYIVFGSDGEISWFTDHSAENIAQSMKAEKPWIEPTPEFFDLLILASATLLNILFHHKTRSSTKNQTIK